MSREQGDTPSSSHAFQDPAAPPPPPATYLSPPYYYRPDPHIRPRLFLPGAAPSPAPGVPSSYHQYAAPAGGVQHPYGQDPPASAASWTDSSSGGRSAWSAGPAASDVFYAQQGLPSSAGPIRRSTSLNASSSTPTKNHPHSPEPSSREELQAQLAHQAQHDKKRRSAESSQRHREKRRQLEREKDARLEFLERKVYQLESELKRSGTASSNYPPVSEATESLVASLRRENYELRTLLKTKSEGDASEDNEASGQSESPTGSPGPSQLHHPPSPLPRPTLSSFSAVARQRLTLAPQLLLRTPSSEDHDSAMDTSTYTFPSPSRAPPTPNPGGPADGV